MEVLESVGMLQGISERFYAITVERELVHPGVVAMLHTALIVPFLYFALLREQVQ